MEHDDDVERLFSWLKTPDLRYREFAAEREVADAASAWPVLRDTIPETVRPASLAAEPIEAAPMQAEPPPSPQREALADRLRAALGRPVAPRNGPAFRDVVVPPLAVEPPAPSEPVPAARHEEARPAPAYEPAYEETRAEPAVPPPPEPTEVEAETVFGGTYRGFEDEEAASVPPAPEHQAEPESEYRPETEAEPPTGIAPEPRTETEAEYRAASEFDHRTEDEAEPRAEYGAEPVEYQGGHRVADAAEDRAPYETAEEYRPEGHAGQPAEEAAEPRAEPEAEDRDGLPGGRSLDELFSRLARHGDRYRDERRSPEDSPGLGPVFRRLR